MELTIEIVLSSISALVPTFIVLNKLIDQSIVHWEEWLYGFFHLTVTFFSGAIIVYPIIDLVLEHQSLSKEFFINELENGTLSLRVTSIITGGFCLFYTIQFIITEETIEV